MDGYNASEFALVLCLVSLMAVIVYFMIPERPSRRRAASAAPPAPAPRRPLWADSPTRAPDILIIEEPARAAAA